jgi:hypothetical protein
MATGNEHDRLRAMWDAHIAAEFEMRDADEAVATMTEDASVLHVPVGTGARGRNAVRKFYAETFIPAWPEDVDVTSLSRTIGDDRVVDDEQGQLGGIGRLEHAHPPVEIGAASDCITMMLNGVGRRPSDQVQRAHLDDGVRRTIRE